MNGESIDERRKLLATQIARQRGELAEAYRNLEKPIQYGEYGLRGFGFLRKNPWVFAAVPAAVSIASTLFGLKKKISAKPLSSPKRRIEDRPKGWTKHVVTVGRNGWKLYQLYRRVRTYLP
jgi:hypothetical protein